MKYTIETNGKSYTETLEVDGRRYTKKVDSIRIWNEKY